MELRELIIGAVRDCAEIIITAHDIEAGIEEKEGAANFVTKYDKKVQDELFKRLRSILPEAHLVGEEESEHDSVENGYAFIVDPIDGTTNFLHAIPCFAISVALKHKDEIIAGVIFNPVTNELYYAEKGQGAFLMTPTGNMRLRVSGRVQLPYSLVGSNGFSSAKNRQIMERLVDKVASIRYNGCTTLSMAAVAAGQLDLYIATQFKSWDLAVGFLLIKEAGGYISDFEDRKEINEIMASQTIIAGNYKLKDQVLKVVRG